jgi:hypothetical protein
MRHIKLFESFDVYNEEIINFNKPVMGDISGNTTFELFNGDLLRVRSFLTSYMGSQDLKFIGSGATGLAFEWINKNLIIKLTMDPSESKIVEEIVDMSLKGIVKYYWIKKVKVPKDLSLKDFHYDEDKYPYISIICMEKLKPLDIIEKTILELWSLSDDEIEQYLSSKNDIEKEDIVGRVYHSGKKGYLKKNLNLATKY